MSKPGLRGLVPEDAEVARHEWGATRIAWVGGIGVTLVTVASLTLLLVRASQMWEYPLWSALATVPVGYVVFCNIVMRKMQVEIFRRFQEQMMEQLTGLQEMVYRDELTGLHNRRHFYERLQSELENAQRSREPLAILLLDLDGLKTINDEYGHGIGDEVLAKLGQTLGNQTRAQDVAARLGGDEFGLIMPGTDKRGIFALARRLWQELEQTPVQLSNGTSLPVSVSIGLAGFPWGGESVEEMIQWADADMYANKVSQKLPKELVTPEGRGGSDQFPEDLLSGI
jgi:diguanylate cyclase (GGDEF)-like protein